MCEKIITLESSRKCTNVFCSSCNSLPPSNFSCPYRWGNGVHLWIFANRWRMRSISYYFRNSSASINNVSNVNYDIDLYIRVKCHKCCV